ncbi:MAG TPA: 5-(carboxyamino)imidazole ribonucleotide synthase [Gemmatimonadaceae bacterium]|nr:5-(carboxyamino)imidazole ribonucleotide synthase [Gemmatimonadaceae bacterium]
MRVGILGGGQLGRMLALSGYQLGIQFRFFDPSSGAPVGQIGELVAAPYDDEAALSRFLDGLDVVTYEFESIPLEAVRFVASRVQVYPPLAALEAAQDRLLEKELFRDLAIPVPAFAPVNGLEDLRDAAGRIGLPVVLKTRRMGYDGKGQIVIRDESSLSEAWNRIGGSPLIVEKYVTFEQEFSVIGVREKSGRQMFYPLAENVHREGILRTTMAPAPHASEEMRARAVGYCKSIMDRFDYVGVLALELFLVDGELLANEMAPRVHNSGHWTIEGAETSQFENHLRAILSLPLGSTAPKGWAAMVNIVGAIPSRRDVLGCPGAHLHLYGKAPTERRKVGHVTLVTESPGAAEEGLAALGRALSPR